MVAVAMPRAKLQQQVRRPIMFTVRIWMPLEERSKDRGGWGDVTNFINSLREWKRFEKSMGAGIALDRPAPYDYEVVTFLTADMNEAVNFLEAVYFTQGANGSDVYKALLDEVPMFALVWQYRRALNNSLRLVKRMPARRGAGGLRHYLEGALAELPQNK